MLKKINRRFLFAVFFLSAALLVCGGTAAAGSVSDNDVEKIYQEGIRLYKRQEYAEALLRFYKLEEIQPDYRDSRKYLLRIEDYLSFKEKQRMVEAVDPRQSVLTPEDRDKRIEARLSAIQSDASGPIVFGGMVKNNQPAVVPADSKPADLKEVRAAVIAEERQKEKEQKVIAKRDRLSRQAQARERSELVGRINKLYREASASYKAGWFSQSREEIDQLNDLLAQDILNENYRASMRRKIDNLENRVSKVKDDRRGFDRRLVQLEAKRKEKEARLAREKAKQAAAQAKKSAGKTVEAAEVKDNAAVPPQNTGRLSIRLALPPTAPETAGVQAVKSAEDKQKPDAPEYKPPVPDKAEGEESSSRRDNESEKLRQKVAQEQARLIRQQEDILSRQKVAAQKVASREEAKRRRQKDLIDKQLQEEERSAMREQEQEFAKFAKKQRQVIDWQRDKADTHLMAAQTEAAAQKQDLTKAKAMKQGELLKGVDELYCDAIVFYAQAAYDRAQELFEEVNKLMPDYKLSRSYLELIRRQKDNSTPAQFVMGGPSAQDEALPDPEKIAAALDEFEVSPRNK